MKRYLFLLTVLALALNMTACNYEGIDQEADVQISGRILDEAGRPVSDIEVAWIKNDLGQLSINNSNLFDSYNKLGEHNSTRFKATRTNSDGEFVFDLKGKDVNTSSSDDEEQLAAYNQIMVLQDSDQWSQSGDRNGYSVIISPTKVFAKGDSYTWKIGDIALWRNNYAAKNPEAAAFMDLTWDDFGTNAIYNVYLRDSYNTPAWSARVKEQYLQLPIDAIHKSTTKNVSYVVVVKQDDWTYRSYISDISDLIKDLDGQRVHTNVLESNNKWIAYGADSGAYDQICTPKSSDYITKFDDNDLTDICNLGSYNSSDGQYISFDFGGNDNSYVTENIDTVVIWNASLSFSSECIALYAVDENKLWGELSMPFSNSYKIAENCDFNGNDNIYTYFYLDAPVSARYFTIVPKKRNETFEPAIGDAGRYYFNSIGEIGIYLD